MIVHRSRYGTHAYLTFAGNVPDCYLFHILQASPLNSVPVLLESLPACFPGLFCFLSGAYFYFAIRAVICVSR